MNDLETAKQLLNGGNYTCVLCKDGVIYTSSERGVSPMAKWIENNVDLRGYSAADKVVGKAAAMLFVLAGAASIYGELMSRAAAEFLTGCGADFSYGTLTDMIINRKGDGPCPMEQLTADMDDPAEAYTAICKKLRELRKEST